MDIWHINKLSWSPRTNILPENDECVFLQIINLCVYIYIYTYSYGRANAPEPVKSIIHAPISMDVRPHPPPQENTTTRLVVSSHGLPLPVTSEQKYTKFQTATNLDPSSCERPFRICNWCVEATCQGEWLLQLHIGPSKTPENRQKM